MVTEGVAGDDRSLVAKSRGSVGLERRLSPPRDVALGPADGPAASSRFLIFLLLFSAQEPLGNAADPKNADIL